MPRLTIIMPVYQTKTSYLAQSISSALSAAPNDSELLIGIDGSLSDQGLELIDKVQGQSCSTRVRVIKYERRGLVKTLNDLVKEADCEFIARHDSDDVCTQKRFHEQIELMDGCAHIDFCGTQVIRCDENLNQLSRQRRYPIQFKMQLLYASLLNNPIAHPTLMIRKSILPEVCYRQVKLAEDWDLYIRLWQAGHYSVNLMTTGLLYRTHFAQATKSIRDTSALKGLKKRSLEAAIKVDNRFKLAWPLQLLSSTLKVTELGIKAKDWLER